MAAFLLSVLVVVVLTLTLASIRQVQQYEQGIVFRFGWLLPGHRTPGLALIIPFVDRMAKVNMQIVVMSVPAQGVITRDNVTVTVDAVVYFRVVDPVKALINVQDYPRAVSQIAQTSLRSVIGRAELDTLLSDRERINAELKAVIDAPTEQPWGLRIERVEVKDVTLPESMKRSMSRGVTIPCATRISPTRRLSPARCIAVARARSAGVAFPDRSRIVPSKCGLLFIVAATIVPASK